MIFIEPCAVCGAKGTGVRVHPVLPTISSCDACDTLPLLHEHERGVGVTTSYHVLANPTFDVPRSDGSVTPGGRVRTSGRCDCVLLDGDGDVLVPVAFEDAGQQLEKQVSLALLAAANANPPIVHADHDPRYFQRSMLASPAVRCMVRVAPAPELWAEILRAYLR